MPGAAELLRMNREAFAERDRDKRWTLVERTYAEDVRFIDPDDEVVGREALNERAQRILDDTPTDFVLEEDGPSYVGRDTAVQAWRFGALGSPAVRGVDILRIRDGLVSVVHTLIAS